MADDLGQAITSAPEAAQVTLPALSILAAAIGADDDEAAIGMAADIGRRHHCSVVVVNAFDPPPAAAMASGFGRGVLAAPVWQAISDRQSDIRQRISAIVTHQGLAAMTIAAPEETGWLTLMRELPLVDLVVLGQTGVAGEGLLGGPLGPALMEARIPVFVARGEHAFAGRPAAVAWDGSFEASRALRAAAPLLAAASRVAILQDSHRLNCAPGARADPRRACDYLHSHGITHTTVVTVGDRKIGPVLVDAARDLEAALLVSGAYGHNRLAEAIFGGATHAFLKASDGPHLLIAH